MGINHIGKLERLETALLQAGKEYQGAKVCDLGNQRMWESAAEGLGIPMDYYAGAYLLKDYFKKKRVSFHTSIDLNGKDGSLSLDLTKPIDVEKIGGPFTVVTNYGTSEHVPGQYWCFRNIHHLVELGGLMCHVVPRVGNWDGKNCGCKKPHCPYYYDTDFFGLLAEANGYKIIENDICNYDHETPKRAREECFVIYQKTTEQEFVSLDKFEKFPIKCISNPSKTGNYSPGGR